MSEKQNSCKCCGKCCLKGGPSFHQNDTHLINKGIIPAKNLYTIRPGELTFDNIQNKILPTKTDIIKIKGVGNSWTCVFFDIKQNTCTIYKNRPMECRILKCWDTKEISNFYSKNRVSRKDFLQNIDGLWEVIEDHNKKCSFFRIMEISHNSNNDSFDEILESIKYDINLRKMLIEKKMVNKNIIDFIIGRPIYKTISKYRLEIIQKAGKYEIRKIA